eukprot:jgi/Botrbrau1/23237/Bobra.0041s0073.1
MESQYTQPNLSGAPDQRLDSDVAQLREFVINEKAGPEILHFEGELVARLENRIQEQEAAVDELEQKKGDDTSKISRIIYLYEIQRVKYLLQCYYKARLLKLEEFAMNILDDETLQERLSPQEDQYVKDYFHLVGRHLKENALRGMPKAFESLLRQGSTSESCDMMPLPKLDRHVFVHCLQDRGTVYLDEAGYARQLYRDYARVILRVGPQQDFHMTKHFSLGKTTPVKVINIIVPQNTPSSLASNTILTYLKTFNLICSANSMSALFPPSSPQSIKPCLPHASNHLAPLNKLIKIRTHVCVVQENALRNPLYALFKPCLVLF